MLSLAGFTTLRAARRPVLGLRFRMFKPLEAANTESMKERARKVFGQPGVRQASSDGVEIAGVFVPVRPDPPTNCCQNGCTECVWVLFKDEFLEYQRQKKKAKQNMLMPQYRDVPWPKELGPDVRVEGRSSNNIEREEGLDPSIEAFVETEKKIKRRHLQEMFERRIKPQ